MYQKSHRGSVGLKRIHWISVGVQSVQRGSLRHTRANGDSKRYNRELVSTEAQLGSKDFILEIYSSEKFIFL